MRRQSDHFNTVESIVSNGRTVAAFRTQLDLVICGREVDSSEKCPARLSLRSKGKFIRSSYYAWQRAAESHQPFRQRRWATHIVRRCAFGHVRVSYRQRSSSHTKSEHVYMGVGEALKTHLKSDLETTGCCPNPVGMQSNRGCHRHNNDVGCCKREGLTLSGAFYAAEVCTSKRQPFKRNARSVSFTVVAVVVMQKRCQKVKRAHSLCTGSS